MTAATIPSDNPEFLTRPDGTRIAYHHIAGKRPGVMFCGGFMSDMTGTKATTLEAHCRAAGRMYTRFDYRGHGQSGGRFADGTIGDWAGDAAAVLDGIAAGPQVVVGSSMGGWIMLLLARARSERIAGLVGIAPAPDFVDRMWDGFSEEIRETMRREGRYLAPSEYSDEPYEITLRLIEEGRTQTVLDRPLPLSCPVRILHGMQDPDVPWRLSLDLVQALDSDDVEVTFVKNGDHRLSEPGDLRLLTATLERMIADLEQMP